MTHLEVLKLEPEWPEGAEAEIEAYLEETHGQGCCPAENLQEAWEAV